VVTLFAVPTGIVNVSQAFTASVSPLTATTPITYIWSATGQNTVIVTTQTLLQTVNFNWSIAGIKQITVTAINAGGANTRTQTINIQPRFVFLPLVMRPLVPPVLNPISNANYTYTVSWNSVPSAQSYVLEEATNSAFTGATQVYNGAGTALPISGRPFGTYYYRVKACNTQLGCSGWSNVQSIYVRWEYGNNDTLSASNGPLLAGQNYYGYPDDGWDCFNFQSNGGTIIVDLLNHTGQGVYLELLYESANNLLVADGLPPYHITYPGPAGRYFVCVYTDKGYNTNTPYTLSTTFP
jgi:hypothetical protein